MKVLKRFLKSLQVETILNIPLHVPLDKVDAWFEDEARFGQQNTTTRVWVTKDTRPSEVMQQSFEYATYLAQCAHPQVELKLLLLLLVIVKRWLNILPSSQKEQ